MPEAGMRGADLLVRSNSGLLKQRSPVVFLYPATHTHTDTGTAIRSNLGFSILPQGHSDTQLEIK